MKCLKCDQVKPEKHMKNRITCLDCFRSKQAKYMRSYKRPKIKKRLDVQYNPNPKNHPLFYNQLFGKCVVNNFIHGESHGR
ncbi:MAG: hypothetical protein KF896_15750 [Ignavibacteriae bacterium]|nr:hypothetical protein [Ignavibacteriota bacterium]